MNAPLVTTGTTETRAVVSENIQQYQSRHGHHDWHERNVKDPAQKKAFGGLAERLRVAAETPPMDHDAAEAEAMQQHFAAPPGPGPPSSDPLRGGLFRGFWLHRERALLNRKT